MAISMSQNFMLVATPNMSGDAGFYNPSASASYAPSDIVANVTGSGGSLSTATFAGESCQLANFPYGASIAITPASANANSDLYPDGTHGILGYGLDTPTGVPANSALLNSYIPPGLKSATAVCGIELGHANGVSGGLFTMGGVDTTAFTGEPTKLLVPPATSVQRVSWSIPVDGIFASHDSGAVSVAGGLGSVDPYYAKIGLPAAAVSSIYAGVPGAALASGTSRYTVPCDTTLSVTMMFGGKNFTMDPRDSISTEGGQCFGTVEATSDSHYQIGSPFLRNVYTTFGADYDADGNAALFVGFADKVIRS